MRTQKLKNNLQFAVLKVIANAVSEKENTQYSEAYKLGLITPIEFLQNSKMKGEYLNEI